MSRVLLFSRDPGGANTVIPLIRSLEERGHYVTLYGKDVALDKYQQAGYVGVNISVSFPEITQDTVLTFLAAENPDIIITGTSADDFTEKYLWLAARHLQIPSLAILDYWSNYGLRFSEFGVSELHLYRNARYHPFLPDRIIVMDELARQGMIADGVPIDLITVCGQPYFEQLLAARDTDLSGIDKRYDLSSNDIVVTFASEPITDTYGENAGSSGYTEITIFSSFIRALDRVAGSCSRPVVLLIRPHPKENRERLQGIAGACRYLRWHVDGESHPWTLIRRSDLVCGMSSMFLVESVIMNRPTLSILIGLNTENGFILDRMGILKSILDESTLLKELDNELLRNKLARSAFQVIPNPIERIIDEMETMLCRN